MAGKFEPVGVAHWRINLGGREAAGFFKKVSGIGITCDRVAHHYGDENGHPVHESHPGSIRFGHIKLERGIDVDKQLWDWHQTAIHGEPEYKDGTIELLNMKGTPIAKFSFKGMWPTSYRSSPMSARDGKTIATETIELAVEMMKREQ
jgi:phage tail-like protein